MVTWMELLTFCLVVIAVIELTRSERAKKTTKPARMSGLSSPRLNSPPASAGPAEHRP